MAFHWAWAGVAHNRQTDSATRNEATNRGDCLSFIGIDDPNLQDVNGPNPVQHCSERCWFTTSSATLVVSAEFAPTIKIEHPWFDYTIHVQTAHPESG